MTDLLPGREERLTFKANLKQTRYGWLRLTPAYSVHLVADLLDQLESRQTLVLDPYCGTGTTALVCAEKGIPSVTTDINPFLIWLTEAKTASYTDEDIQAFRSAASAVQDAIDATSARAEWLPDIHQIEKWWDSDTLRALGRAMGSIRAHDDRIPRRASDLLRAAFCRVLIERACVSFGHQSMSFKKPSEQKSLFGPDLTVVVRESWAKAVGVFAQSAASAIIETPLVLLRDAREPPRQVDVDASSIAPQSVGCVITSPPYPNRMSYIRELRPYMYWLGYLSDARAAGELDWKAIGGTWGCATSNVGKWTPPVARIVPYASFEDILQGIAERSDLLSRYVHKYFYDMTEHMSHMTDLLAPGAALHYIVGNSKFYDVMLPVQEIYAAMFADAGLVDIQVETIRKRSSKKELYEYIVSARKPPV